jgi:ribosomal protein S4E
MARGPKKHLKKINTPKSWLLSKMDGIYATRPSQGPHKLRECLPLSVIIKYISILRQEPTETRSLRQINHHRHPG